MSSVTPGIAIPADVGNQGLLAQYVTSESTTPIAIPAVAAIPNDVNRASRAAPRAGTTASGIVVGSSCVIGTTRTPNVPASRLASTVLASDSSPGGSPASIALVSSSDAARVARPKRVKR